MAIINHALVARGRFSGSNYKVDAMKSVIAQLFSSFYSVLSQDYTRVDTNTLDYDGKTNYYFRETYKISTHSNKYLVVQINILPNIAPSSNNALTVNFYIAQEIVSSSTSQTVSPVAKIDTSAAPKIDIIQSTENNITTWEVNILFNLLQFKNESVSIYCLGGAVTTKTQFLQSMGKCTINDEDYLLHTYSNATNMYFILYNKDGDRYYTYSFLIATSTGTVSADSILTLPIYLSNGNVVNSQVYNLKLENALQCPNNACSYGGIYNIGGVDYFAIGNNFLLKM